MPSIPCRLSRSFFVLLFLVPHVFLLSPSVFSGFFPLDRIYCGVSKVKVKTVKDLEGNRVAVGLNTVGKKIALIQRSAESTENIFFILPPICDGNVDTTNLPSHVPLATTASSAVDRFSVGENPIDMTGGDFNGDGHLDLAVANFGSDSISILLNDAGAGFVPPNQIPTGSEPRAIISADFNNDGKMDLATANLGDGIGDLSLLLAIEDGRFAAPVSLPAGSSPGGLTAAAFGFSPIALAAGDFDRDGNMDLAVADSAGNASIRRGNGNGTFQAPTLLNAPGQFSILAEDVNGDGSLDVITNEIVLLNNGSGNFPEAHRFVQEIQPTLVRSGDFNEDGILDLVTANASTNCVAVFLGRGDGSFQSPLHYIVGNGPGEILIEDLDSNGTLDLAVSNLGFENSDVGTDHLSILWGTGDGGFIGGQAFRSTNNVNQPNNQIALADFDGDGFLDMAAANLYGNGEAAVLKGQAFGKFAAPLSLTGQTGEGVVAGDFNGNNRQDLVLIQKGSPARTNDALEVHFGNGDLSFGSPSTLTLPDADLVLNFTLSLDLDNNGSLDLVTANTGTDDVSVFLGNGNGTFQSGLTTRVGNQPMWLAAGLLDGNATLDLAVVNAGPLGEKGGKLSVLFGNGNGSFSPGPEFLSNMEPNSVIIGDINGDGKSDLAAIVQSPLFDWRIEIIPGNDNGTFGESIVIPLTEKLAGNLTSSDLDRDGDLDLLLTLGHQVGLLENNGNGTFRPLVLLDGGVPMGPLKVADLNHDLRPDLVIPQIRGGTTAVLLNIADAPTNISHDMNGDGMADLLWRDTRSGAVALWFMNGSKIVSSGFTGGISAEWQIAAVGDVNADGKADVICRNTTNGLIAVWFMNGLEITSVRFLKGTSTAWSIAGTGDLNGNGTADLVWRNTSTGEVGLWMMEGATIASTGFPGGVSLEWEVKQVGDVNADGNADVIWQNKKNGVVAVWLMNGLAITSVRFPGSTPVEWNITGTGDVNGNETMDIVWRNSSTGEVALWVMNEGVISSTGRPGKMALDWKIARVGDMTADGKADIVWHNEKTGAVAVWLMNGLSIASVGFPGVASTDWKIQ